MIPARRLAACAAIVIGVYLAGCTPDVRLSLDLPDLPGLDRVVIAMVIDRDGSPVVGHSQILEVAVAGPAISSSLRPRDEIRMVAFLFSGDALAGTLGVAADDLGSNVEVSVDGEIPLPAPFPGDDRITAAFSPRGETLVPPWGPVSGDPVEALFVARALGQLRVTITATATDGGPSPDSGAGGSDSGSDAGTDAGTDTGPPPTDFYVDDNAMAGGDGSMAAPFDTLPAGVAMCDGTLITIHVAAGTYQPITMPPNCIVQGAGMSLTIIDAGGLDRCVWVPTGGSPGGAIRDMTIINGVPLTGGGGGIYVAGGTLTIERVEVSGSSSSSGGGIRLANTVDVRITDSVIMGNTSPVGGGVNITSSSTNTTVEGCTISGNTSTGSGGGGLRVVAGSDALITNTIVEGNFATAGSGAGIYVGAGGTATLTDVAVVLNTSSGSGGGINVTAAGSTVDIDRLTISGNVSGGTGGGITISSSAVATIANTFVTGNDGGGIHINAITTVLHATVAGNTGGMTGGVHCSPTAVGSLTSSIVWGNGATGISSNCTANYSDLQDNTGIGMNNIMTIPGFVNALTGDYHLMPGSLCVNAGNPGFTSPFDVDGDARTDNFPDMGADEI